MLVDVFHTTTPVYTRKMPYDAVRDFTPVSLIARSPLFLVSSPAFEPRTLRDFVAYARANPHKTTMAIAGTGSVVTDLFRARSQLQLNIVPYKGAAPAIQDLMAGQVNAFISTMASAGTQVLIMPEVRERLASLALEPASGEPQEMQRKVEGDFVKWQALARELDIKPID